MDLSVNYLGLELKSPLVVGSSSLTSSLDHLKKAETAGAGAVVLKSIFEEEIYNEYNKVMDYERTEGESEYAYLDYYDFKIKQDNIQNYIKLIKEAKSELSIPVIASINCSSNHEWMFFAKKIQEAGADAIELNLFILPSDFNASSHQVEDLYFDIINKVKAEINIPLSVKLSYYSSNLAAFLNKVSESGVDGIVLFNRFFHPDFDIDTFEVTPSNVLSNPSDLAISLRWISLLSGRVSCDLIASTGVHDGSALIKQLLAGADAVQVASVLFTKGIEYVSVMLDDLKKWMEKHGFENISDFKAKMSQVSAPNPAEYERVQFMKYFGHKKYDLD
ncbi:MAG: dihydroorotate dehydrogenase-like protein [Chlorobi bacterium]|nr:dihydroorotate dehydrogenase-like protein [Chlorobiota bacterium]